MAQVFLSYARDDVGRAKALAAAIEKAGFSVWWDRELVGGAEYSREIDDALKAADVVVVLWSKVSVGSAWVRDEAAAGRDTGRLVPARLDDAEVPLGFRQYQTIDLSRWNGRSDSAAVKTLKRAIAAKVGRTGHAQLLSAEESAPRLRSRPPLTALMAGLLVLLAAAAAYFWYARSASAEAPTIAIVGAPSGAEPTRSEQLARSLSVEIGALQAAPNSFELLETAAGRDVDFIVQVAAARNLASATADLSIITQKDRSILWTGHFEKPATQEGELRVQASTRLAAVLACLGETVADGAQLDQTTLKLYLRSCENFRDEIGGLPDPAQLTTLRTVVERAPDFAPALAHLALVEVHLGEEQPARRHIAEARRLNPRLAKIYLAEVDLLPRRDWTRRQAILAEGLKLDPNSSALHDALSFEFGQIGRRTEAMVSSLRARQLDPLSPVIRANYVHHLFNGGRIAEAKKELEAAERIWPASNTLADTRYAFELRFGDPKRALQILQEDAPRGVTVGATVNVRNPGPELFIRARIDPTPENIQAAVEAYVSRFRRDPADIGSMTLSLVTFGRVDAVFEAFDNPVAVRSTRDHTNVFFRPYMKPMLHDPRFMALAARLGLVRYWTETGKWPDFCLDDDLPYDCKAEAAKLKAVGRV